MKKRQTKKGIKKSSKPKQTKQEKLKLENSTLSLKSTPPNTLNASSPP
jgi:hypothetical protein